jgi:hypothetical protein
MLTTSKDIFARSKWVPWESRYASFVVITLEDQKKGVMNIAK